MGHRANGQTFPIETSVASVTVGGKPMCTVVLRDITVQKRRQHAMTQSQKMLAIGALASGVAHDFNNILTAIISHLDLAASSPDLADSLRENITYAQTSARRGADLVGKLLTFSRQTEPKLEHLNLYDLGAEVVAMLRRSIDRRIRIRHELVAGPLRLVLGDSSQAMQVLMNLCINARDAMSNGGELCLRLENVIATHPNLPQHRGATEFVKLTVSDTGTGMTPEVMNRLFEPYFTTKASGKGTGLGLSIAYGIVTDHGGWMDVESAAGAGSKFHVYFPAAPETALPQSSVLEERSPVAAETLDGNERVLVVDDDEMVRLVVRAVLSYRGYQVIEASDGEQALERFLTAGAVDVVLLDLDMPRLNGWDTMAQIRQKDPNALVILLSGIMTDRETERATALGATGILTKPFENPELARIVRRVLDASRGRKGPAPHE